MPLCFSLKGYRRLYRSLLRYANISMFEAKSLLYLLNIANIDTCRYYQSNADYKEMNIDDFFLSLNQQAMPYKTLVQTYKALEALEYNIHRSAITDAEKEALERLNTLLNNLEREFYERFKTEIDSLDTTYGTCNFHLTPYSEPNSELAT